MTMIKLIVKTVRALPLACEATDALFSLVEKLTGNAIEKYWFRKKLGYGLNLKNPQSFNEKIIWKKFYDRNPLLPVTADKYRVRGYVRDVLGTDEYLVPLLHVTDRPETIPFLELPDEYVIKANHAEGGKANIFIRKNTHLDRKQIITQCGKWLRTSYASLAHEWAYENMNRKILVEKLLHGEDGGVPKDYKFHMINGKCAFTQVDIDRFGNHKRTLYDDKWNYLHVLLKRSSGGVEEKPRKFGLMLSLAEKLSADFAFIRVDFYAVGDKIYVGELTHYPGSGKEPFYPREFDFELGRRWELKPEYWKNGK